MLRLTEGWDAQAGCSDAQVREYFGRLRSSVRSFIQRFQRKTLGIAVGSHAAPAAPGIPAGAPTSTATGTAAEASAAAANPEEDSPGISEAVKVTEVLEENEARIQFCKSSL